MHGRVRGTWLLVNVGYMAEYGGVGAGLGAWQSPGVRGAGSMKAAEYEGEVQVCELQD